MRDRRTLTFLLLVGIIISGSGASLLAASAVAYNNSPTLAQYAEFWTVARGGGGLLTDNINYDYIKMFPFTAEPSDLRMVYMSFNVSASQPSEFDSMMQFFAALSCSNTPFIKTPWLMHSIYNMSNQATDELLSWGLSTPHNITVYYVKAVLYIFADNRTYTFSFDCIPYISQTEKNGTNSSGVLNTRLWELDYHPYGTFTYYVPDLSNTILNLGFNSGGNLSFSLLVDWNVSFWQKYGPGLQYAGNATIANWVFRKLDTENISVSIDLNNTNYHPPVPAFAVIPWRPVLEAGVLVTGFVVTVVGLVLRKKYSRKVR